MSSISRRQFIQQATALLASTSVSSKLIAADSPNNQVGVVLDSLFFKHDLAEHPENAKRLQAIDKILTTDNIWPQLTPVKGRFATDDELLSCHQAGYIEEIKLLSEQEPGFYNEYQQDTYFNQYTYDAARMAAGSNINLNLAVYDRQVNTGFALLRPPGHHALENRAMGFCIFNSDVIAAKALQKERGVKNIAIIDIDVHHGNGTQDLTDTDPSIMAVSIHQHPYWPLTGGLDFTGHDDAEGTVVNCPFHKGAGNKTYLDVYDEVVQPKLEAFKPEHIIVFAGYDGHWQDPLAQHQLSVKGFNALVQKCLDSANQLCGGRISFSLGGGYNLNPLAQCVAGTFHTLLDNPQKSRDTIGEAPEEEVDYRDRIEEIRKHHLAT